MHINRVFLVKLNECSVENELVIINNTEELYVINYFISTVTAEVFRYGVSNSVLNLCKRLFKHFAFIVREHVRYSESKQLGLVARVDDIDIEGGLCREFLPRSHSVIIIHKDSTSYSHCVNTDIIMAISLNCEVL